MGTKVLTVTECEMPKCKARGEVTGAIEGRLPSGWSVLTMTIGSASIQRTICPKHTKWLTGILAATKERKKRKDAGILKGKKVEKGQQASPQPSGRASRRKGRDSTTDKPKEGQQGTTTLAEIFTGPAAENRHRQGIICPPCNIACTKEGTDAIVCAAERSKV